MSLPRRDWFQPGDGIAREVIYADIQRYLGRDATARRGYGVGDEEGVSGYWINAHRNLTTAQVEDLKRNSESWRNERRANATHIPYAKSNTFIYSRQHGREPQAMYKQTVPTIPPQPPYPYTHQQPYITDTRSPAQAYYSYPGYSTNKAEYPGSPNVGLSYQEVQRQGLGPGDGPWAASSPSPYSASAYSLYAQHQPRYTYEPQQAPQAPQVTLAGTELSVTPTARSRLQEGVPASSSVRRLADFFTESGKTRTAYSDSDILEISALLKLSNPKWSRVPRIYVVLRTIGCLDVVDKFIDVGFTDHWFPVEVRSLPAFLRPSQRLEFVAAQRLVITKAMDLERGQEGQHCYFLENERLPFESKESLGSGGFGEVDRVLSLITLKEYARKRVPRNSVFGKRGTNEIKQFVAEIEMLKRLQHHHVVEFVGSYTDPKFMGLLMTPVADMDLSKYLSSCDTTKHRELRTFFGCLTKALEFLHSEKVRHKDIKPGNILVHQGNVLLTDFGLSYDFTDKEGSTTVSMVNFMTRKYCAPEVAMHEPRNKASDIWSLGVVFLEMMAVLKSKPVQYIYEFFREHGSQQELISFNPTALPELVEELENMGQVSDNIVFLWIQQMLLKDQQDRPTATAVVELIIAAGTQVDGGRDFCGSCCLLSDDDF